MKKNSLLVLIVVVLSFGFLGCAKHRYLTLLVDTSPSKCAEIYIKDSFGDREIVADERTLNSASATNGFVFVGRSPQTLYFYFLKDEGTWKKELKKYIDLPEMIAIWPSGAKVIRESYRINLDESVEPFVFKRPLENETPGWNVDMQCEANQIAAERNRIEQEGVSAQQQSNVQQGILGGLFLYKLFGN